MENTTTDFRKWLAYNDELNSPETVLWLVESLQEVKPVYKIQLSTFVESGESFYMIQCGNSSILKLNELARLEVLRYIREHYLKNSEVPVTSPLTETSTLQIPISKTSALRTFSGEAGYGSQITGLASKLASVNTFVQAFRFSLAGVLIFQLIVIPQFILDIDIPGSIIATFAFIVITVLSHISVRLYRKHFTADDKVRYSFVWRLVIPFSVMLYAGFNAEVTLLELLKGTSNSILATLLLFVFYVAVGVFIGMFSSLFAYLTNGGKVLTPVDKA